MEHGAERIANNKDRMADLTPRRFILLTQRRKERNICLRPRRKVGKAGNPLFLFRNPPPVFLYLIVHGVRREVDFAGPYDRPIFCIRLGK